MKNIYLVILGCLLTTSTALTQDFYNGDAGHGLWPDSLETLTVTGVVMVDSFTFHPMYYLDENGDEIADYHLSFGPWWYESESGAVRPQAGDIITILGGITEHGFQTTLMVFEIDGMVWRDAVAYGMAGWNGSRLVIGGSTQPVNGSALKQAKKQECPWKS